MRIARPSSFGGEGMVTRGERVPAEGTCVPMSSSASSSAMEIVDIVCAREGVR